MEKLEYFETLSIMELKEYLKKKGITSTGHSKQNLIILCQASTSLVDDPGLQNCNTWNIIEKKLLKIGITDNPKNFNYSKLQLPGIPPFGLVDVFNYLICSRTDYDNRKLKAFKSFDDYKLFEDGHVEKLEMCQKNDNCFFRAAVLPTCRKSTFLHKRTYSCWFMVTAEGDVHVALCECMGG